MVIRELFAKLGLDTDGASFSKGESAIGGVKKMLIGLGVTLTAGAVYHGLKHLVDRTADLAFQSTKAAQRIGVNAEAFDELGFAAEHSGLSLQDMEYGLRFLGLAMARAKAGSHELSRTFSTLGVNPNGKNADEMLMSIAEGWSRLGKEDPRRLLFARELFGREGARMIPFLDKGKEGIAELREEARKLGIVFSTEDREAAQAFRESTLTLHATLEALERSIGTKLMRTLADGKRGLTEWLKANREIIREKVVEWVKRLVNVLEAFLSVVGSVSRVLYGLGQLLWQLAEGSAAMKGAFVVLGIAIAMALAPGIVGAVLLLGIIEELWGWISGKRKTMLEDWLGPYSQWSQQNKWIDDLIEKVKLIGEAIAGTSARAKRGMKEIRGFFNPWGQDAEDLKAESDTKFAALRRFAGGSSATEFKLMKDPRFQTLATEYAQAPSGSPEMNAAWDKLRSEYAVQWAPTPAVPEPGRGGGDVSIGEVHLHGASTDSPEDFSRRFAQALNGELGAAHAAVAR